MRLSLFLITVLIFSFSCSSNKMLKGVSKIAEIAELEKTKTPEPSNADSILRKYTIEFSIPNPLYGDSGPVLSTRKDPSHPATIDIWARLLDDFSTEADIMVKCKKDSLSKDGCNEFAEKYRAENQTGAMFRILLFMESGFSEKSLEPDLWSMYVQDASGVLIEPDHIQKSPVTDFGDSVSNDGYQRVMTKRVYRRSMTLFFKKKTFYGEDLLGGKSTHLIFAISREKKENAKIAWKIRNGEKNNN